MNTCEMLKAIEGTNKVFIDQYKNRVDFADDGYLCWNTGQVFMITRDILENSEWEEVKEPVSFMEAVESGKYIKVEHDLIKNSSYKEYDLLDLLMLDLADDFDYIDLAKIIKNGKWYIED